MKRRKRLDGSGGSPVPARISDHAILRYLQRHMFPERGEDTTFANYTPKERSDATVAVRTLANGAVFVMFEKGNAQSIWRYSDGTAIVVLDDLVNTVLPKGTVIDESRRRA